MVFTWYSKEKIIMVSMSEHNKQNASGVLT